MGLTAWPIDGLPEVGAGADLGTLVAEAAELQKGDVIAVAHKVVSKAEGRVVSLSSVEPGEQARELAVQHGKDPRAVQVVLDESAEVLRAERGVLICRTRHGFVCANAGVDASNAPSRTRSSCSRRIPTPRRAACGHGCGRSRASRWRSSSPTASAGRGATASATSRSAAPGLPLSTTGAAGRTGADMELRATWIAVADEVAGAADLVRAKDSASRSSWSAACSGT